MSEEERWACDYCGHPLKDDEGHYENVEPANYGMNNPYPGYDGDFVCNEGCED